MEVLSEQRKTKRKARRRGEKKFLSDRKFRLRAFRANRADGSRAYHVETFHGTSEQADLRLAEILTSISKGENPKRIVDEMQKPASPTLSEALERWLKHKADSRKTRPRTLANYKWLLDTYIKPVLGSKPVNEISEWDIQQCYHNLLVRGLSPKTIRNTHKVLEPCLKRAEGWKLLSENPATHVELPVWERKEAKYLDAEQTKAFLETAKQSNWYAGLLLAIETGARPNEWLALRWSDVSLENRSITIKRSLYWPTGDGYEFTKPKTKRSTRTNSISTVAVEALRQHKRAQNEHRLKLGSGWEDHQLVFTCESGGPMCFRNLDRRYLKPLLTAAGISTEGISLYTLRHTSASLMIANDENPRVIAEQLGTSIQMIDDTYSHVPRTLQQSTSDRMAKLLHG